MFENTSLRAIRDLYQALLVFAGADPLPEDKFIALIEGAGMSNVRKVRELTEEEADIVHLELSCLVGLTDAAVTAAAAAGERRADVYALLRGWLAGNVSTIIGNVVASIMLREAADLVRRGACTKEELSRLMLAIVDGALCFALADRVGASPNPLVKVLDKIAVDKAATFDLAGWLPKNVQRPN